MKDLILHTFYIHKKSVCVLYAYMEILVYLCVYISTYYVRESVNVCHRRMCINIFILACVCVNIKADAREHWGLPIWEDTYNPASTSD